MSGVDTRSRLEQLASLQRRTQHEIASAHRRGERGTVARLQALDDRLCEEIKAAGGTPNYRPGGAPRTRRKKAEDRVTKHLERLGVTAHDVKTWAVTVGLLDAVRRGRIKAELVDAYEQAHTPTSPRSFTVS